MNGDYKMGSIIQYGQLLNVDLGSSDCCVSAFPETAKEFIGGRGFNIWYLYHNLAFGTHPLAPENILLMSCGLLTGSSAPTSSRLHLNALSPLTGILGSSNIGGYAGAWLRSCNIASIVIKGKSKKPVILYIDSQGARFEDASHLWGRDTFETQEIIKRSHKDKKLKILTIGPGGEGKVKFGAIMTEKDHAAGRTGMGSVMGSKNLKAIVICKGGHKHFPATTPTQKEAVKVYVSQIKNSSEFNFFSKYGSSGYVKWVNDLGVMGRKNYGKIGTKHIEKIDARKLDKNIVRSSGCFRCPVQCKADLKLDGLEKDRLFTRPEFEPVLNLGPKCGLKDLTQIIKLDNLCSRLGVDSTSTASVIAFAMDLFEKKLLPENLVGDLDLSWGNADTMEKLIFQMIEGKGLGKILCLGVRKASTLIGNGASKYAAHIKGLELTAYHPSAIMGTALGYAVSSRGGDYNNVYASLEYSWTREQAKKEFGTHEAVNIKSICAKGWVIKKAVTTNIIIDSLGLCKVPVLSLLRSFNLENELRLINGLTDLGFSKKDLFDAGEKIATLEKLFNIRHEKGDIEDTLPEMFFNKDSDQGLTLKNFETMLQEYYTAMGWDEKGVPPEPDFKTNFIKLEEKK
jgi:aldehyde:ferredoxin oxidoreductase